MKVYRQVPLDNGLELSGFFDRSDPRLPENRDSTGDRAMQQNTNDPIADQFILPTDRKVATGSLRFRALLASMWSTHMRKNAGYSGQDNPDSYANFRGSEKFGVSAFIGTMVRMGDKWSRITNLVQDAKNEQVGESIKDTLIDLANYALIAICLLEEEEAKKAVTSGVDQTEFTGILAGRK